MNTNTPKILLIGDSIRLGYDALVKEAYRNQAQVLFPDDNCRFSTYVLRNLHEWAQGLGCTEDLACIHWNVGAWDTLTLFDDGPLVPLSAYEECMERICKRIDLLFPSAKKIFATTTPMAEHLFDNPKVMMRYNSDIEKFNDIAISVVKKYGHEINDLYALMSCQKEDYHSDTSHYYTKTGAQIITKKVCNEIDRAIGTEAGNIDFDMWFDKTDCYEGGAWLEKRAQVIKQRAQTLGV